MIKNFVTKPLFTLSIFVIVAILGLFSYSRLPLDLLPDISIPTLTVITPYPGAGPADIETTVSKVIEDAVATVPNIDKITSDSIENLSTVTISFKWGSDLDSASADVRDKMDLARSKLPRDVQPSTIFKFDLSQIPVLVMGISAQESYTSLYEIADKKISPALKKIQGVGTVNILGGLKRQINVEVDRVRMEAYKLSMPQVNAALAGANLSIPAGNIKTEQIQYGIRLPNEFTEVPQIEKIVAGSYNGRDIYLSDIAAVSDSFAEPESSTEVNGRPGIMLQIQKQSGANTVQVVEACKKEFENLKNELPEDVEIVYIRDNAESIVQQLSELGMTLVWAFLFVMLTVLLFLRNTRGSLIISASIPFSLIAAVIYMFVAGNTINIISLASIIISIGVVVDDAIVVLENIYRHRDKKREAPKEASIYGAGEVAGAVLAATTTNLVIFIPLLLVSGFVGIFFRQLATISIVIISMSYVTAVSLTPMLCSRLLEVKKDKKPSGGFFEDLFNKSEKTFLAIEDNYKRLLGWALNKKGKIIAACAAIFFLSLPLFYFTGVEFFPDEDDGFFSATVSLPPGVKLEQTYKAMKKIEDRIKKEMPEMQYVLVSAGSSQSMAFGTKSGPNYGRLFVKVIPLNKRKRNEKQLQRQVVDIGLSIPGVKSVDFDSTGANSLSGSTKPITVELYGSDFEALDSFAETLLEKVSLIPGVVDPSVSREKSNPEYSVVVDRDKASDLGLSVAEIGSYARSYLYGTIATKYREGSDEYDIFSRFREKDRKFLSDIKNVPITTRLGKKVTLGNLAKIELKSGPQVIQRKNQQRIVKVEADNFGRSLGDITGDINRLLQRLPAPQGVSVKIAGSSQDISDSFKSLFTALLLGICLIYLVMVAQFESFLKPFFIMFSIPFAIIGVVWALFLTGNPFGVMPFIGLILVTGISVKNTIVLVDYINILQERGKEIKEAVLEAGRTRLRPILMTSLTTALGLMPIIFGTGEGSGFWKTMAISVVGGLSVSLVISLIFVPTLYYMSEKGRAERSLCGKEER